MYKRNPYSTHVVQSPPAYTRRSQYISNEKKRLKKMNQNAYKFVWRISGEFPFLYGTVNDRFVPVPSAPTILTHYGDEQPYNFNCRLSAKGLTNLRLKSVCMGHSWSSELAVSQFSHPQDGENEDTHLKELLRRLGERMLLKSSTLSLAHGGNLVRISYHSCVHVSMFHLQTRMKSFIHLSTNSFHNVIDSCQGVRQCLDIFKKNTN